MKVKMKVLVACETSGAVREAFKRKGHEVYSCDLLPAVDNSPLHIRGDAIEIIYSQQWDMIIAHPPCTYLSVSGMHWTTRGLRDPQLTEDAVEFAKKIFDAPADKICIENPISILSTRIRKPDQIIQPWMFGHDASKKTCLWLKGLPELQVNKELIIPPAGWNLVKFANEMQECSDCGEPWCNEHDMHYADCKCYGPTQDDLQYKTIHGYLFATDKQGVGKPVWANQTPSGQNKLGPSKDRWKKRSETYQGIAEAMSACWG